MKCQAAVTSAKPGQPFERRTVDLDDPREDEIRVRIKGVGICHTDIAFQTMLAPLGPQLLGHEGAGIVERVGSAVKTLVPGDKVVLTFRHCGECAPCQAGNPAYCARFEALNVSFRRTDGSCTVNDPDLGPVGCCFFGQSSFADHAIAYETNAIKIADDVPLEIFGPLGCGVQTGAGAVLRSLDCPAGSTLVITGGGTVGLSALLAATVAGCKVIAVSEPSPDRRRIALELGATHVIDPTAVDLIEELRHILPDGFEYAIDTTARVDVIASLVDGMAARGVIGLLGMCVDPEARLPILINEAMALGLSVRGVVEGDSDPARFIPELIDLWRAGRFPFDRLIRTYRFDQINEAIHDQEVGTTIKAVLLT